MNELFAIAKTPELQDLGLIPKMSNRHGLIAGATGTGKTVTLRKMAECFSDAGIPVFLLDVKGDLSGIAEAGENSGFVAKRMQEFDLQDAYLHGFPVRYWDVFAQKGLAVRITISEMGPVLLSHLLGLNDTQSGLLSLVFKLTGLLGGRRKSQASMSNKIGSQLGRSISNEVSKSISRTIMGIIKGK